jgi:hypothetical protein
VYEEDGMKRRVLRISIVVSVNESDSGERGGNRSNLTLGEPKAAYRVEPCQEKSTGRVSHLLVHLQVVVCVAQFEGFILRNSLRLLGGDSVNDESCIVKAFDFDEYTEAR